MKPKKPSNIEKREQDFFEAISAIETPQEARAFFKDLSTPSELQAMVDRWLVVDELVQGKSYRTIHDETGVSVTTVGRVARCLEMGEGGYKLIYDRLKKL